MNAYNVRTGRELSNNVAVADSLLKRMKGLLGREEILEGEALWIRPCMSIHTFLMRFSIDVIFLDKTNRIVAVKENLPPNHITSFYLRAASVLELPAGTIEATSTAVGDKIEIGSIIKRKE